MDFEVRAVMGGVVLDKVRNAKRKKGGDVDKVTKWLNREVRREKAVKGISKEVLKS